MVKKWQVAALLVGVYVCFMVALMPATFIVSQVKIPKGVSIHQVSGTVWQPKFRQVVVQNIVFDDVEADISPWGFFGLSLDVDLKFGSKFTDGPKGYALLSFSSSNIQINKAKVTIAAQLIAPYIPAPVDISAFGQVEIKLQDIDYMTSGCLSATGDMNWQRAAVSALDETVELGDFSATLGCEKQQLQMTLNPENQLGITFVTKMSAQGVLSGEGYLSPPAEFPKQLREVLPFLGQQDNQGRYRLEF